MPKLISKETKEKIKFAADKIANGASKRRVKELLCDRFDITPVKAEHWYKMGVKSLEECDSKHYANLRTKQRERLETILEGAMAKKDYISATKAIETMNKMFGIYETKQVVEMDTTIRFDFANDINNEDENEE